MNVNQLLASKCKKNKGLPKKEESKPEIAEEKPAENQAKTNEKPIENQEKTNEKPKKKSSKKAKVSFMVPEEIPEMPENVLVNVEEDSEGVEVAGTDDF